MAMSNKMFKVVSKSVGYAGKTHRLKNLYFTDLNAAVSPLIVDGFAFYDENEVQKLPLAKTTLKRLSSVKVGGSVEIRTMSATSSLCLVVLTEGEMEALSTLTVVQQELDGVRAEIKKVAGELLKKERDLEKKVKGMRDLFAA